MWKKNKRSSPKKFRIEKVRRRRQRWKEIKDKKQIWERKKSVLLLSAQLEIKTKIDIYTHSEFYASAKCVYALSAVIFVYTVPTQPISHTKKTYMKYYLEFKRFHVSICLYMPAIPFCVQSTSPSTHFVRFDAFICCRSEIHLPMFAANKILQK